MEDKINNYTHRIVNLRIKVYKYNFDAAIDCNFTLHNCYKPYTEPTDRVDIELYNFDKDWDIKVISYADDTFPAINQHNYSICHTVVDNKFIIDEIKKWIAENNKWYRIWYKLCHLFK